MPVSTENSPSDRPQDESPPFDPEMYVQQQTGRVLTKLFVVVIGVQLAGVFLWLLLVFTGVMDATANLDEFLITQLVVFLASVVIGIGWAAMRIRGLSEEAQQMSSKD